MDSAPERDDAPPADDQPDPPAPAPATPVSDDGYEPL
jgi:hypothetical protein